MHAPLLRRCLTLIVVVFSLIAVLSLSSCSSEEDPVKIRIGTMPTEDILPMWVAEEEGLFEEAGIDVEIVTFDSASALSAAITAGEVDMAMTDPMRAIKLCESGVPVSLEWVTLGTDAQQGVFGVLVSPESGITSLQDLTTSQRGVALAANTVPEYVFDKLCEQQGIDFAIITTHEIASLPDRYGLVAANQIDAAALPNSMLVLGQAADLIVIADDSSGLNVSQSVMIVSDSFNTEQNAELLALVRGVWDIAAAQINADPEKYRELLVEHANLNETVAATYPISVYPMANSSAGEAAHPSASIIEPIIAWMKAKEYLRSDYEYDEATGSFTLIVESSSSSASSSSSSSSASS